MTARRSIWAPAAPGRPLVKYRCRKHYSPFFLMQVAACDLNQTRLSTHQAATRTIRSPGRRRRGEFRTYGTRKARRRKRGPEKKAPIALPRQKKTPRSPKPGRPSCFWAGARVGFGGVHPRPAPPAHSRCSAHAQRATAAMRLGERSAGAATTGRPPPRETRGASRRPTIPPSASAVSARRARHRPGSETSQGAVHALHCKLQFAKWYVVQQRQSKQARHW